MWLQFWTVLFTLMVCQGENFEPQTTEIDTLFKKIGFTPSCVTQTLALCEDNQGSSLLDEMQAQLKPIIDSNEKSEVEVKGLKFLLFKLKSDIKELKSAMKVSKSIGEAQKSVGEELKSMLRELKSDIEKSKSVGEEQKSILAELKSDFEESKSIGEDQKSIVWELKADIIGSKSMLKCSKVSPRNCADLLKMGDTQSGVRKVEMRSSENRPISVLCDQTTDGGGWTVIQRRADLPQREDFFRDWAAYQRGFGNLTGEFWLGLDNIHALVSQTPMELRVDLEDFDGEKRWAKFDKFYIEDSAWNYKLTLGEYSGDAGDSLSWHDGMSFSTRDKDNDNSKSTNCAEKFKGAWWYAPGCHASNFNGFQHKGPDSPWNEGITWDDFRGREYSLKSASLSVRPLEGK